MKKFYNLIFTDGPLHNSNIFGIDFKPFIIGNKHYFSNGKGKMFKYEVTRQKNQHAFIGKFTGEWKRYHK